MEYNGIVTKTSKLLARLFLGLFCRKKNKEKILYV